MQQAAPYIIVATLLLLCLVVVIFVYRRYRRRLGHFQKYQELQQVEQKKMQHEIDTLTKAWELQVEYSLCIVAGQKVAVEYAKIVFLLTYPVKQFLSQPEDVTLLAIIDEGNNGEVWRGTLAGATVVIKRLRRQVRVLPDHIAEFQNEVNFLRGIR